MNIVWNTIQEQAKAELDRLADLYKQAGDKFNESIGTKAEKENLSVALAIFDQMETTKRAFAALGITGQVGVHFINKVGA